MHKILTGQKAPDFSLLDSNQNLHSLSHYSGKWLILFFYPKDNTPGCTKEACQFRDKKAVISALNGKILGINTDNSDSHTRFIEGHKLPFPLLTDTNGVISRDYGCLFKLGPIKFCKRSSFIIDPQGNIAKVYEKVVPSLHSEQVIYDLKELQQDETTRRCHQIHT